MIRFTALFHSPYSQAAALAARAIGLTFALMLGACGGGGGGLGFPSGKPELARAPYLQQTGADTVVVRWRTAEPSGSTVLYGTAPDRLNSEVTGPPGTDHRVTLPVSAVTGHADIGEQLFSKGQCHARLLCLNGEWQDRKQD